jgi:hypothetical protein
VAATHGRSFWVLDDISPLRELTPQVTSKAVYLFRPRLAYRTQIGYRPAHGEPVGENPPTGATLYYYLKKAPEENAEVKLEILDSHGHVVRSYSSKKRPSQLPREAQEEAQESGEAATNAALPAEAGLNRFNWDLRYEPATKIGGYSLWDYEAGTEGPRALPGTYQVRFTAAGETLAAPLEVKLDPRVKTAPEELQKQFDLAMEISQKLTQINTAVNQIRSLRSQLHDLDLELGRSTGSNEVVSAAKDLDKKLAALEEKFINPKISASEDSVAYAIQLDGKLAALETVVESSDAAPTEGSRQAYADLGQQAGKQLTAWDAIRTKDLTAFNQLAQHQKVQAIMVPTAGSVESGVKSAE